jgi:hypothetical protein
MNKCFLRSCDTETDKAFCVEHWSLIPRTLQAVISKKLREFGYDSNEFKKWAVHGSNHIRSTFSG